jgi:peptide/nickel transport system substrate-binding protein
MMRGLFARLAATSAAVVLAFAAGGAAAQTVLRVAIDNDLKIIDPHFTTSWMTRDHGYLVFDTLFALDGDLKPTPQMVKTHTVSPDGLAYSFTLRDGLSWHDGTPVTAKDCVASIKRWGSSDSVGKLMLDRVASMQATSETVFTITLNKPFDVISTLAKPGAMVPFMMPERLANTPATEQIKEAIGSGPFRMLADKWVPGQKVVYAKNAAYKPRSEPASGLAGGKVVNVDFVELLYMPDSSTTVPALMSGEVDMIPEVPLDLVPVLEANADVVVRPLATRQTVMRLNHTQPPFNNIKVRQAVLWAIDQEKYMKVLYGNPKYYKACRSAFICGTPYETNVGTEALAGYDIEKARQLVKEAGAEGARAVILDPTDSPDIHAASLLAAENLRKIGLNVDVQAMDFGTLFKRRAVKKSLDEGGWSVFHTAFPGIDMVNPLTNAAINSSCDGTNWPGWPCSETIESLRNAYASATDEGKKKQIVEDLQREMTKEVTYVWLGEYMDISAHSAKLAGLVEAPFPVFWNVKKK